MLLEGKNAIVTGGSQGIGTRKQPERKIDAKRQPQQGQHKDQCCQPVSSKASAPRYRRMRFPQFRWQEIRILVIYKPPAEQRNSCNCGTATNPVVQIERHLSYCHCSSCATSTARGSVEAAYHAFGRFASALRSRSRTAKVNECKGLFQQLRRIKMAV